MGSRTRANLKAAPSAPTDAPARSGGASAVRLEEFPPKPRGMHWATYWRLEALEAAADNQWMAAVVARFGRSKNPQKPRSRNWHLFAVCG